MRRPLLAAAVLCFAGCMEVEQANSPQRQAGQTVRRDTAAWDNEPLAKGPKWEKGKRETCDLIAYPSAHLLTSTQAHSGALW